MGNWWDKEPTPTKEIKRIGLGSKGQDLGAFVGTRNGR